MPLLLILLNSSLSMFSLNIVFSTLLSLIKTQKGFINGDKNLGTFEVESPIGLFKGKYNCKNNNIIISIDKKPFFISTKMIASEIKKYLEQK